MLHHLITQAIQRRASHFQNLGYTNAFRLFDGAGDGFGGLYIDYFDGAWLVQTKNLTCPAELMKPNFAHQSTLWHKRLDRDEKSPPRHLFGEECPMKTVLESGLRYQIDFASGYSQGLFIDQRLQRLKLREMLQPGQRMLNLFAYTCAFSVAAASMGAVTDSVDLSRPYLDWGRINFRLNNMDPDQHFFCRGDAFSWLKRLARKGRKYHVIILDPPTFSRNDAGTVWRVEKDYPALVAAAGQALEPGGTLLCSTNHHALTRHHFQKLVASGLPRPAQFSWGEMPSDFTDEAYLKALWARM